MIPSYNCTTLIISYFALMQHMENSVVKQNNVTHTYMHRYNNLHIVSMNKNGLHKTKNNKLKSLESPVNLDGKKIASSP